MVGGVQVSVVTKTIWLGGGGGTWMQAPTKGTSRKAVVPTPS